MDCQAPPDCAGRTRSLASAAKNQRAREQALQAFSFRGRLYALWSRISTTLLGDIISTAIAIGGVALLFLASAFGLVYLARLAGLALQLLGAR